MTSHDVVFKTPWFHVEARPAGPSSEDATRPYFVVCPRDYVTVLATTPEEEVLLVEVYRPTIPGVSVELPSGTLEEGEMPLAAAARELLEETGCVASRLDLIAVLHPDSGRLGNVMYCFRAWDAKPTHPEQPRSSEILRIRRVPNCDIGTTLGNEMSIAIHLGVIGLAAMRGLFDIASSTGDSR